MDAHRKVWGWSEDDMKVRREVMNGSDGVGINPIGESHLPRTSPRSSRPEARRVGPTGFGPPLASGSPAPVGEEVSMNKCGDVSASPELCPHHVKTAGPTAHTMSMTLSRLLSLTLALRWYSSAPPRSTSVGLST